MTEAESKQIADVTKQVLVGEFDHTHIRLLLISVRDRAKNELVRELGDSVAHPVRTKGLLHARIFDCYDRLQAGQHPVGSSLSIHPPFEKTETVSRLSETLGMLFPTHRVYTDRLIDQAGGIFLCTMCILQGSTYSRGDVTASFKWGCGASDNFCLFVTYQRQKAELLTAHSVMAAESDHRRTEINRMQEPPFGCYVRGGAPTMHMLW